MELRLIHPLSHCPYRLLLDPRSLGERECSYWLRLLGSAFRSEMVPKVPVPQGLKGYR